MKILHIQIFERCFQLALFWLILLTVFGTILKIAYSFQWEWLVLVLHYVFIGLTFGGIIVLSPLVALGLPNAQKSTKTTDNANNNLSIKGIGYVLSACTRFISRYYHLRYTGDNNEKSQKDKYTTSYKPSLFHIVEPFLNILHYKMSYQPKANRTFVIPT
ncbi:MAG: hypothetical protein HYY41_00005 [Chloroflexi bacterium]|nr:hypothetical protein [Chloroflexota bacterium]